MMRRLGWPHIGLLTTLFVERVMDPIQHAINAPIAEVSIDGAAGRKILGKVTPLASRAQHVHEGVERLSHVRLPFAASPPRRRNERFDMRPLLIRQVARVSQMIPLIFRSVLVRPHRRPPNSVRLPRITTDSCDSTTFGPDTYVGLRPCNSKKTPQVLFLAGMVIVRSYISI